MFSSSTGSQSTASIVPRVGTTGPSGNRLSSLKDSMQVGLATRVKFVIVVV